MTDLTLTELEAEILATIARRGRPCIPLAGLDAEAWSSLDARGLVELWAARDGPVITLSAYCASALGMTLVRDPAGRPVWRPKGSRDAPERRPRRRGTRVILETDLGPDYRLERSGPDDGGYAPPRYLLGSTTPWVPWRAGEPCPVCGGRERPMPARTACLRCDRSAGDFPDPDLAFWSLVKLPRPTKPKKVAAVEALAAAAAKPTPYDLAAAKLAALREAKKGKRAG